jgi:transcriptional regulator with XRE-family HTH domain
MCRGVDLDEGFRQRMRQRRKELGWTQETLAYIVGYSPVTVRYWENGTKSPREQSLVDWMDALR